MINKKLTTFIFMLIASIFSLANVHAQCPTRINYRTQADIDDL